jgi:hypothetical protein
MHIDLRLREGWGEVVYLEGKQLFFEDEKEAKIVEHLLGDFADALMRLNITGKELLGNEAIKYLNKKINQLKDQDNERV